MNPENVSMTGWVVSAVLGGGLAVLGFLVRHSFNGLVTGLAALAGKVDVMAATIAKSDGDVRELRAKHDAEIAELKRRLDRVEQVQREIV